MLPAAHVGRMASRDARPKRAVTVGSTAPIRPPNQPAIAPSRRAREPTKAPRDTVLAATAAASVAWRLAVSTAWRYCCSYCSTWVRVARPECSGLLRERPRPDCAHPPLAVDHQ